jgi:hypothetical protein
MVLGEPTPEGECLPKEDPSTPPPNGWFGLMFWLIGFGFLLFIAVWDMLFAVWKTLFH